MLAGPLGVPALLFAAALLPRAAAAADYSSETRVGQRDGEATGPSGPRSQIAPAPAADGPSSVADTVESAPGVDVQRAGALGAPAYASIRGSDPYQVRVFLDGIPLHGAHDATFDLASIPAELLGRVTVHRSNVPVQLGAASPGGVLELETLFGEFGTNVYGGGGSFATRRAGLAHQRTGERGDLLLSGAYSGAGNRYPFFDDGGTPLNPDDDGRARRANAHVDTGSGLVRHRARVGQWRLTTVGLGSYDVQGLPGPGYDQAHSTELRRGRAFAAIRAERPNWPSERADLELVAGGSFAAQRYLDPDDELGFGAQDQRERADLELFGLRPSVEATDWLTLRGVVDWLGEGYHPEAEAADIAARRDTLGLGAQADAAAWNDRLELRAALRSDLSSTRRDDGDDAPRNLGSHLAMTPHAGVALTAVSTATFSARAFGSAGLAERQPSFFELYGDRGLTVGNPDLLPERRRGLDGGVQLTAGNDGLAASLTWAVFAREIDDLILFVETGLGVRTPVNVARATVDGHELAAEFSWNPFLQLRGNVSSTRALDRSEGYEGTRLPGRPRIDWAAEASSHWWILRAAYRVDGSGTFTTDRRELRPMPRRIEHDLTLAVEPELPWRPSLALAIHNLADTRTEPVELPDGSATATVPRAIADLAGYPLPGRAFYLTLAVRP